MRLTFGSIDMSDGVKLLPAIIGLFGMAEMLLYHCARVGRNAEKTPR
jgi:TctA family transporter